MTIDICPIHTSYDNFLHVLNEIRNFTKDANKDLKESLEYLEVSNSKNHLNDIKIDNGFDLSSVTDGPDPADTISYNYRNDSDEAPISEIYLSLTDSYRKLSVSGYNKTQVNALVSLSDTKFNELGCSLGGLGLRTKIGIAVVLIIFVLGLLFLRFLSLRKNRKYFWIAFSVYVVLLFMFIFFPPLDKYLAGTSISVSQSSFYTEHPWWFGIIASVIGGFLVLGLGWLWNRFFRKDKNKNQPPL